MYKFSHTVKSFSSDSERYIYRNIKNNIFYISPVSPYKEYNIDYNKNNLCRLSHQFIPIHINNCSKKIKKDIFTGNDIGLYIGEAFDIDISESFIFMDGEDFY